MFNIEHRALGLRGHIADLLPYPRQQFTTLIEGGYLLGFAWTGPELDGVDDAFSALAIHEGHGRAVR